MKIKATSKVTNTTVTMNVDGEAIRKNRIETYFHCSKCLDELPEGMSPKEWSRTQVGVTKTGAFQIWCNRHNCNVAIIDFDLENVH